MLFKCKDEAIRTSLCYNIIIIIICYATDVINTEMCRACEYRYASHRYATMATPCYMDTKK